MSKMVYVLIAAVIAVIAGVYYFVVRPNTLTESPTKPAENAIIGGDPATWNYESPQRADLFTTIGSDAPAVPAIIAVNQTYKGETVAPIGQVITSTGATVSVPTGILAQMQTGPGGSMVLPTDDQLIKSGVVPAQVGAVQAGIMKELIAFNQQAIGDPTVVPTFWNGSPVYDANGYRNPDPIVPAGNPNFIAGTAGMPYGATFDKATQSWYVRA